MNLIDKAQIEEKRLETANWLVIKNNTKTSESSKVCEDSKEALWWQLGRVNSDPQVDISAQLDHTADEGNVI